MSLRLIVTADDFGIGVATSAGIIDAHLHGPVTATSLMTVTGDHARASVPLLRDAPRLEVGLHLVLTDTGERPLRARASSGLITRDGRFLTNAQLWLRAWTGLLSRAAVLEEVVAQAEEFVRLLGRPPAYVDGHHHAHQLPVVREALTDAVAVGLVPPVTRVTVEPSALRARVNSVRTKRLAAHLLGCSARAWFARRGLRHNEGFFGMLSAADLAQPCPWHTSLRQLPRQGTLEWVVHPGRPDETLYGRDPYVAERAVELRALIGLVQQPFWTERFGVRLLTKTAAVADPFTGTRNNTGGSRC